MSQQEPNSEQIVGAVYGYAAELAKAKLTRPEIESKLVDKGLDQESAAVVVDNLFKARSKFMKEAGRKNMLYGALWCAGGAIVTMVTYDSASKGGGRTIVAWGAILFGAIQFFRGLVQSTTTD